MRKHQPIFWTIIIACFVYFSIDSASAATQTVRVGLLENQSSVEISADAGMEVINGDTGAILDDNATSKTLTPGVTGVKASTDQEYGKLRFKALTSAPSSTNYLKVNGKPYRGEIEIYRNGSGLTIVNEVSLDQYLYGVVPSESPASWPAEALKAQAVAARNYVLTQLGRHRTAGFDVCPTVHCQVYGGVSKEDSRSNAAVDATSDKTLTYNGKPISTYFFSCSGGYTENVENVWQSSDPLPYLVGVIDYDQDATYYNWQVKMTRGEVQDKLAQKGVDVGELQQLKPIASGVSGRIKTIAVIGSRSTRNLSGEQLRSYLGFKSSKVTIQMSGSVILDTVTITGAQNEKTVDVGSSTTVNIVSANGTTAQQMNGLSLLSGKSNSPVTITASTASGDPEDTIVFNGGGYGHGIGLSQWGARGMALKGYNYVQILQHYYQGTVLQ